MTYIWQTNDMLIWVAASYLYLSNYPDIPTLMGDIATSNPTVIDWWNVPIGTQITIPKR